MTSDPTTDRHREAREARTEPLTDIAAWVEPPALNPLSPEDLDSLRRDVNYVRARGRTGAWWTDEHMATLLATLDARLAALPDSGERAGLLDDLRAAIEIMDGKVTPYGERKDGTTAAYIVGDATWHRVLSVARGHVSDAARAAIDQWRANGGDPDRDASVALDAALSALATPTRDAQPAPQRDARPGGIDYPGWLDPLTGKDKAR